jgi:hypothetical protein
MLSIENKENEPKGRGTWKFNSSLLKDVEYTKKINNLMDECEGKYKDVTDKGLKWDVIKSEIRGATISYSSYKAKTTREAEQKLLKNINRLEVILATSSSENNLQELQTDKKELELINAERSRGVQLRAKCMHLENNEANSKYFLTIEKTNANTKNMSKLITDSGTEITKNSEILSEQRSFYEKLYTDTLDQNDSMTASAKYFLDGDINIKKLSDDEKEELDDDVTMDEIAAAVKDLATDKSPGSDGITPEFYVHFWPKINIYVTDSINHAITTQKLSIDQRRGILTLIPKKDKDVRYIKNWRPLSLLNTDYKLLAKILATRLQKVLDSIISLDQSGCIKGRSTFTNIRSTVDIINYANENHLPGILAFIDFEKAFDTVNWNFIYRTMEKMNFGPYFINCFKTLYNDISTMIINNGHLSQSFNPTRGIRQGCPISANVFVIIVEILAEAIRQNQRIIGIRIGNKTYKIAQYADDTVIYLTDVDSLKEVFSILELFSRCSGLKANREKSEAMWIGASSNYRHTPLDIKWPEHPIKCLGIYIQNDTKKIVENNFNKCLEKIDNILQLWCLRKMTIKGKIIIINTLIISQMIYLCSVLYTPKNIIEKYNKLILNFIWNKKPAKVKYTCIINNIDNGGLKLQDIECKIKSLKLKWIKKLMIEDYDLPWKTYIQTHFRNMDSSLSPYYNMTYVDFPSFKDHFYSDMFRSWAEIHSKEPENAEQAAREIIWHNTNIRLNLQLVKYKQWQENKIIFIQDLLDAQGKFATAEYLSNKYNIYIDKMAHNSLITSIPRKWKNLIKTDNNVLNYYVFLNCKIMVNEVSRNIEEVATRDLYLEYVNKVALRPTSEKTWQDKIGLNFDENRWAQIYRNPYQITKNSALIAFHFKVTHRIMACTKKLHTWKISKKSTCDICNNEVDDIEHYLVACPQTLHFWNTVFEWWKTTFQSFIATDTYDIIFGMINENDDNFILHFNFILLHGCHYVYRCKKATKEMCVYNFLLECKNKLIIEQELMISKQKIEKFEKKWGSLLQAM